MPLKKAATFRFRSAGAKGPRAFGIRLGAEPSAASGGCSEAEAQ